MLMVTSSYAESSFAQYENSKELQALLSEIQPELERGPVPVNQRVTGSSPVAGVERPQEPLMIRVLGAFCVL